MPSCFSGRGFAACSSLRRHMADAALSGALPASAPLPILANQTGPPLPCAVAVPSDVGSQSSVLVIPCLPIPRARPLLVDPVATAVPLIGNPANNNLAVSAPVHIIDDPAAAALLHRPAGLPSTWLLWALRRRRRAQSVAAQMAVVRSFSGQLPPRAGRPPSSTWANSSRRRKVHGSHQGSNSVPLPLSHSLTVC